LTQSSLFVSARDGTRLFVRYRPHPLDEARPTAILCDGIACDGFIWKYLWDDLARHMNAVHWHYRGHGRSARPSDPAAIELVDHARDLDTVRRMVGAGPAVLFGHSMGCQVALEAFRLRREDVLGMVLICGSYGRVTHTFKGTDVMAQLLPRVIDAVDRHTRIARGLWGHLPPEVALRIALLTGEVDAASIVPADLLQYMKHMVDIDLPMFLRMLRSAGEHSARDMLGKIDVPVLVLAGDRDTFTPTRYAEEMAKLIPTADLKVLNGTHVIPIERKDQVAELIERFVRSIGTSGLRASNPGAESAPGAVEPRGDAADPPSKDG